MDFLLKEQNRYNFSEIACQTSLSKSPEGKLLDVDSHWHDMFEIVLCGGAGTVLIEGDSFSYQKGDIIFIPCRFLHGYRESKKGDYTVFFVCAEQLFLRQDSPANSLLTDILYGKIVFPYVVCSSEPVHAYLLKILLELKECVQKKQALRVHALLFTLFSEMPCSRESRNLNSDRHTVQEIITFMERNFSSRIDLDLLSKKAAMSKFNFIVVFKRYCGVTPMKFLINTRLKQAYMKLSCGYSVTESAFSCGFNNLSYFTRQFKTKFGAFPKTIKKLT